MKFLVDAQLPLRLARLLSELGYDTLHTRDLPQQNATPDLDINTLSISQQRIVITKDTDFLNSFLILQYSGHFLRQRLKPSFHRWYLLQW